MGTVTVNKVMEEFDRLGNEDKEYTLLVLNRQLTQERRKAIARRARETRHSYTSKRTKSGYAAQLLKDLTDA